MISTRLTFAIYLLAATAGALLYRTSYAVDEINAKIVVAERQIIAEQSNIQVLGAEWTYLTEPSRIEQLASKYLHLEATKTQRVAALHDAGRVMDAAAPAVVVTAAISPPLIAPKIDPMVERAPAVMPARQIVAARTASPLLSTVAQRTSVSIQAVPTGETPNSVKLLLASFHSR